MFFDLDGTLLDTEGDIRMALSSTLEAMRLNPVGFFDRFQIGPPFTESIRGAYPDMQPEEMVRFMGFFYTFYDSSDFPETRPYPGIDELLRKGREKGRCFYIATNKRYIPTQLLVEKFGWKNLFSNIFTVDRFAPVRMTKPEMFHYPKIDLSLAVMIGDAATDISAAKEVGISAVGVSWGYSPASTLSNADFIANSVDELAEYLEI